MEKLQQILGNTSAGLVIIDTWRLIAPGKENEAETVVKNLRALDHLHSINPDLAILLVHHLRKSGTEKTPTLRLRQDPQLWLENASGSHAFIAHTDCAFGLEHERDTGTYVFAGIRRNGPAPMLMLKGEEGTLRFDLLNDSEHVSRVTLTPAQLKLWNKLPEQFSWKEALELAGGKKKNSLLSETLVRARDKNLLTQPEPRGIYLKADPSSPETPLESELEEVTQ